MHTILFVSGMNVPDIRVIHFGVPSTIDEYIQETGKGGRDGELRQAIILRHKYSLSGSVSQKMKDYLSIEGCRHRSLFAVFRASSHKVISYVL